MHQIVPWTRLIARWPHWQGPAEVFCAQHGLQAGTALCAFIDEDDLGDEVPLRLTEVGARQVADALFSKHRIRILSVAAIKRTSTRDPSKAFYVQFRVRPATGAEQLRSYYAPLTLHQVAVLQAWETGLVEAYASVQMPFALPVMSTCVPASQSALVATKTLVYEAPAAPERAIQLDSAHRHTGGPAARRPVSVHVATAHNAPTDLGQLLVTARLWRPTPGEPRNLVREINLRRALIIQTVMQANNLPAYGDGRMTRTLVARALRRVLETAGPFRGDPRDDVAVIAWLRDQLTVPAVAA